MSDSQGTSLHHYLRNNAYEEDIVYLLSLCLKGTLVNQTSRFVNRVSIKITTTDPLGPFKMAFAILCCAHMPRKIPKQREGD